MSNDHGAPPFLEEKIRWPKSKVHSSQQEVAKWMDCQWTGGFSSSAIDDHGSSVACRVI